MDKDKILKAGKIAQQIKDYIKPAIKKGVPLLEIATKIEEKIIELGGKPAFPTNLSIDKIAAHYTPSHNDETLAHGLLKVDFGVHVDGWTADTSFSIDLENSDQNQKLIDTAKKALDAAIKKIEVGVKTSEIGKTIQETIEGQGAHPIINLCGHEMKQYELHAGLSIPNIDDNRSTKIKTGLYAIEPFTTFGSGKVKDGKPSGIYILQDQKSPRSPLARKILEFIAEEYQTLPFCARWIVKKFGPASLFSLKQLEENGNLHNFAQLVETSDQNVAQAENTILIEDEKIVTSE